MLEQKTAKRESVSYGKWESQRTMRGLSLRDLLAVICDKIQICSITYACSVMVFWSFARVYHIAAAPRLDRANALSMPLARWLRLIGARLMELLMLSEYKVV